MSVIPEAGLRLPEPSPTAIAASLLLIDRLRADIEASGGALDFERYMARVLYDTQYGYYAAGQVGFGVDGDFITAPERSTLFGRCLAQQIVELVGDGRVGRDVLEFGAGSGRLACDVLTALDAAGQAPERYLIVDPSAALRERQRATLAGLPEALRARVSWVDEVPEIFSGTVLANEVIDALPVRRFVIRQGQPRALAVSWGGERFVEVERAADADLIAAVEGIGRRRGEALPEGFRSEYNASQAAWLAGLSRARGPLAALIFDYGWSTRELYHFERRKGTLMCHYRHLAHDDPYVYPGLQDITAHVDFSLLAEQARALGFDLAGYVTQAGFLLGAGGPRLFEQAYAQATDETERYRLSSEFRALVMPTEMGERFKLLALTRGVPDSGHWMGLSVSNRIERL